MSTTYTNEIGDDVRVDIIIMQDISDPQVHDVILIEVKIPMSWPVGHSTL